MSFARTRFLVVLTCCVVQSIPAVNSAQAGFIPAGLNPGDRYQLVFVTRGARDAASSDINDYHAFVQQQANLSSLTSGITWKAIGSTVHDNAITNAPVTAAVYNLAGGLVATDPEDFWNTRDTQHSGPIAYDQFGDFFDTHVWTGTEMWGNGFNRNELGRGEYGYSPMYGISSDPSLYWVGYDRFLPYDPALELPLYGLSEELVVPDVNAVPEPTSFALLAGFAATCVCTNLRRRMRSRTTPVGGFGIG